MNSTFSPYCHSLTTYKRLQTREVYIGSLPMGGDHPIRIQSMTNTPTHDTHQTVQQIKRIADKGADLVRMTTRTVQEAENLQHIKASLQAEGYTLPLVADVHFNPKIAETAARHVEKVRINPGNYSMKKSSSHTLNEAELNFQKLIDICKKNQTAIRIGVNHGSLSQRIMDKYGDTPRGMAESAMEFIRLCQKNQFHLVVVSMKSSNTRVMVQANRLLVNQMLKEDSLYPLHLGVTEAGEGEDGRIKSAVGIGTLLSDGIGDTIRVSLTEAPEMEIPVAKMLTEHIQSRKEHAPIPGIEDIPLNPFEYHKRKTLPADKIGGAQVPVVITDISSRSKTSEKDPLYDWEQYLPDFFFSASVPEATNSSVQPLILPYREWIEVSDTTHFFPLFHSFEAYKKAKGSSDTLNFIRINTKDVDLLDQFKSLTKTVFILETGNKNKVADLRRFLFEMMRKNIQIPVVIRMQYRENDLSSFQIKASEDFGTIFVDGLAEGIWIQNEGTLHEKEITKTGLGILQASRIRIFQTEFISCPGCGRTQFNLEDAVKKVRSELGHLTGLKIAVMGCIVNGPGEMADADYGYVGAGPGKISLYKNKEVIKQNVPEEKAVDELIKIIRDHDDWREES